MPILVDNVDDRVKLQLGDLLLNNIVLTDKLERAQQQISDLTAQAGLTPPKAPKDKTPPAKPKSNGAPAQPA